MAKQDQIWELPPLNVVPAKAAAKALGHIKQDDPRARNAVTTALIRHLSEIERERHVRIVAAKALGQVTGDDPKARDAVTTALIAVFRGTDA